MPARVGQNEGGDRSVPVTSGQLGLGERLRSARKARAISLERMAESLHLDEAIVLALEDERFEELGAPVFVRGHLKAYARLVGLPIDSVLGAYQQAEPQNLAVPPAERRMSRSLTINPVIWGVSALVVLLGVLLALYVVQDGELAPATTSVADRVPAAGMGTPAEPPAAESDADTAPPVVTPALAGSATVAAPVAERPESVAAAPGVRDLPLPEAAPATVIEPATDLGSETATAAGTEPRPDLMRVSLHFREESWVEISDANRRLLFGLQREGRRRELAGEPPFRLLLGNAAGVDVSVNDEPYVVPDSGVTGKVARFEIDATVFE